jgi:hypothetical protein
LNRFTDLYAQLKEKLAPEQPAPLLNVQMQVWTRRIGLSSFAHVRPPSLQAKWRPFPDFDLFRREENTEALAGFSKARVSLRLESIDSATLTDSCLVLHYRTSTR